MYDMHSAYGMKCLYFYLFTFLDQVIRAHILKTELTLNLKKCLSYGGHNVSLL